MTLTAPIVHGYLDLPAAGGDFFFLNDPVKGLLNDPTYVLAGDDGTPEELTATTIRIARGRTNLLEDIPTGTAEIQFNNHQREFDPFNVAGDYYGKLVPRKKFTVTVEGVTVFTGRVEDWEQDYDVGGDAVATCTVIDNLGILALSEFDEWTTTDGQTAGPRLDDVLDRSEVAFSGGARDLDTGVSTLQDDLVSWGSNVLNYCQLVARSDLGALFDSREGVLTFRDRHANLNDTAVVTFADGTVYEGVLTDESGAWLRDETGEPLWEESGGPSEDWIPFHGVSTGSFSDLLYGSVSVDAEGFTKQTATNATAVSEYGGRLAISGLLLDSEAQALSMAEYLAGVYGEPHERVRSITVKLHALTTAQLVVVLSLDLSSLVRVVWTPRGVGDPVDRHCIVEGVDLDFAPGEGFATFHLSDADRSPAFTLNDDVFGVLGSGVLAF